MPTDPKWRSIARKSGRPISGTISVFIFMMRNAGEGSENDENRGSLRGWVDEDIAASLDIEADHVHAIRDAMQGKVLDGDRLSGWSRRQPKREDGSAERSKKWRRQNTDKGRSRELAPVEERDRPQTNAQERSESDSEPEPEPESEPNTKESSSSIATAAARANLRALLTDAAKGRVETDCANLTAIERLINEGCDLNDDIIPFVSARVPLLIKRLRTWNAKWLVEGIREASADRRRTGASVTDSLISKPFVAEDSPLWPHCVNRYRREKNTSPPQTRHERQIGWFFAKSWVEDARHEVSSTSPRPPPGAIERREISLSRGLAEDGVAVSGEANCSICATCRTR
jgi:hypothetical protein